jgi:hypothetical protein
MVRRFGGKLGLLAVADNPAELKVKRRHNPKGGNARRSSI